jgi:hypothetical protein
MKIFKLIIIMITFLAVSLTSIGCSHFRFTPMMCDAQNGENIPQECYEYDEEEALKASDLTPSTECKECSQKDKIDYK